MTGRVLHYDMTKSEGFISGDDGGRYAFTNRDWKEADAPVKGAHVDFVVEAGKATGVFFKAGPSGLLASDNSWYKSSDDKALAGVCAGVAHKHNVSVLALRVITVVTSIFFIVPLILYIVLWIILEDKSTRV